MKNKKIFNKSEDHQHFGLRKLSVGVASVLLGTTFMIYGGRTVQADNTSQVITSQVANNDNSSSVKNVNDIDSKAKNTQVDALQIEEHQHQAVIDTRNNETAKVNNDEEKKDTGSSALENEDAKKVEEKSDSTVANVTKSDANNASSVNNVKSNEASNNSVVEHQQNVTDEKKNDSPISNEELEKIFKLNKPDLSNDQLAALGLKPGEYKLGDIIYNAKGTAVITDRSGKEYNIDNLKVLHNADGSAHNADKDLDFIRAMVVDRLAKAHFTIKYIPAIDGSTIYVNKDAVLSSEDAKRGVINSSSTDLKNAVSYNWDNSNKDYAVSTKDVGTYNGMIDVAYQIGKDKPLTKVAVGVKVVVVDLNGKDQYTHIGADIPTAETSINGAPAGSKATWTEKPSTDKAGKSEGVVEVTYPDGNKGTTTSTLNVIAPDVKDPIHVWEGDPVPKAPTVVNNTGDIANKIPGTTTYTWDKTPDTSVPGTVEGTIVTHWPDGKTTNTSTTIVVDKRYVDVTEGKGTTENITRTIYTQLEGHDPEYKDTQTVTLNRTGTKDLKESEKQHKDVIKWNPWQPQTMNAYQAPEIKNYHVLNPNDAPEIQVNGTTKDMTVTFQYAANHQQITDGDGTHMEVKRDIYTQLEGHDPEYKDTQTVTLHRTGDKNLATGEIVWGAWGTDNMKSYAAPEIKNYHVLNPDDAPEIQVTSNTKDMTVTFQYAADHQQITDGDGTHMEVKRNIYTQLEGHDPEYRDTQTVTLHRTGDKNLATGEIVWGAWGTGIMKSYAAPTYTNYTVQNPDDAPAMDITSSTKDMNVTFKYLANHQQITDGDGTHMEVRRNIYIKKGDNTPYRYDIQIVTLHRTGDKNLATGEIVWGAWGTGIMKSYAAPSFTNYTVQNPDDAPAMNITSSTKDMNVTFNYTEDTKEITDGDGTQKNVTRDIYTHLEEQPNKVYVTTQTATLHRKGVQNLVTGKITWGTWDTATLDAFSAPSIKNYHVLNPEAATKLTVNDSTQSMAVTFEYAADHQQITDGDGTQMDITRDVYEKLGDKEPNRIAHQVATLHRTGDKNLATGKITWGAWSTDTMAAVKATEHENYTLVNPNAAPAIEVNSLTNSHMIVTFIYTENHENITTGDGTQMDVTRDVYTQIDNEKPELLKHQVVILHRTGDKNMVTGEIVWNAWQPGKIDAIDAPAKDGYTLVNPGAATAVTVDGSKKTIDSITYHYTANEQSVNVNYVDEESHKVVTSISVAGKTGETVSFDAQSHVPTGWVIVAGQTVPDHFTFIGTPLKDQTILIHHNENDRYKVVADGDVTTHVGANENVPSLTASGVKLSWSEDGKTVSAPDGVNVAWENVPATNKIANEQGTLKVTFKDGTTTTVNVSVTVQGATAGDLQTVDQNADVPEAKTTVNTSTVDHFGITNVEWSKEPSTKTPGADIPGVARVNYSDGTYQDVDVALDVRGVEHGQDHQDDEDLFLSFEQTDTVELPGGITKNEIITTNLIRDRITDYKYPVGDSRRVTYTDWVTQTVVKYA